MSLYKAHQDHTNITEARKHAVKIMTRETGMAYFLKGKKTPKSHVVMAVKAGYFDGFYYQADYANKTVNITANLNCYNLGTHTHKIGN